MPAFTFRTAYGLCSIRQHTDGRWWPWWNDEPLGSYHSPASALDDLLNNAAGAEVDTSAIGLPEELSDWSLHP